LIDRVPAAGTCGKALPEIERSVEKKQPYRRRQVMNKQIINNNLQIIFAFHLFIFAILAAFAGNARAISVHPHGASLSTANNFVPGASQNPQISADGRYVVFESRATTLVPGITDSNNATDIFVRDLQTGTVRCLSLQPNGQLTGGDASRLPRISADGRYVVFTSLAPNLVANDINGFAADVFRYDLQLNQLEIVSINAAGTFTGNRFSASPEISPDGRFVVFMSEASDLINNFTDNNADDEEDVYLRDMQTGTTRLVSAAAGSPTAGGNNVLPSASLHGTPYAVDATGRFVVFGNESTNLVTGLSDANNALDVFVRDMQTNTTVCASVTPAGNQTVNGPNTSLNISADGRRVFFQSTGNNVTTASDTNSQPDVFVRDLQTGVTQMISVNAAGSGSGNKASFFPGSASITPDGRFVVFNSDADNLVSGYGFTPNTTNVYVRAVETGKTRLVSVNNSRNFGGNALSTTASNGSTISPDGRFIVFRSNATNLLTEDTNPNFDIYLRDLTSGRTTLLSPNLAGTTGGNNISVAPVIAADARRVTYQSDSGDLVAGDNNSAADVFYADFAATQPTAFDFDGDGRADVSVFRPSEGNWYMQNSSTGFGVVNWGLASDKLAPADYDGDGKTDFAVFRPVDTPSNVTDFYILNSANFTVREYAWGVTGDLAVPADYDGDGKADVGIWRPSETRFYVLNSADSSLKIETFGQSTDKPQVGDFDGDGKADPAIFRPAAQAAFQYRGSLNNSSGNLTTISWGVAGDTPVAGDYDADGKTDPAVYRGGAWYVRKSTDGNLLVGNWGLASDTPAPADYDGDAKTDFAVYRSGVWYLLQSASNQPQYVNFGLATDTPLPSVYAR
jgi:Tol biopolymer transport system component